MLAEKLLPVVKAAPSDPYFYDVTMLLTGDGTNGAQNNTFLDSSGTSPTITRYGNTTQGSFSPYGSLWSNYLSGSANNYFNTGNTTFSSLGTANYTVECWFNSGSFASSPTLFQFSSASTGYNPAITNSISVAATTTTSIEVFCNNGHTYFTVSLVANAWYHLALVRNGSTLTLYLNGVSQGTTTDSYSYSCGYCSIGSSYDPSSQTWNGYISNFRAVKGTAVYTSNFTPSTTPLTAISGTALLACQSNNFIDNSGNAITITPHNTPSVQRFSPFNPTSAYDTATIGGSAYFDGTGDYLTTSTPSFDIRTNSFTFEAWIYPLSTSTDFGVVSSNVTNNFYAQFSAGGDFYLGDGAKNNIGPISATTSGLKFFAWNYFALTFDGTTYRFYMNGVRIATSTTLLNTTALTSLRVGSYDVTAATSNMYMGDFRYLKGTAQYTGTTMTVPTAPLSSITNTNTLLLYTNAGIPDSAMMNDLETVGNAQVSTSVKKYGTGSLYFDGTGDYLSVPNTPNLRFGTGDFTIEFWVNQAALTGYQVPYSFGYVSAGSITIQSGNGTGNWGLYMAGSAIAEETGSSVSTGTWYHMAFVRSGTSVKIYRNGTSVATGTSSANINYSTAALTIGAYSTYGLNGYIDDLRITKGVARYVANFTPPTAALPTY